MDKIFNVEIDGQITLPDGRKLGPFEETTVNVVQPSEGGSDPIVENAKQTGGFGYTESGDETVLFSGEVTTVSAEGVYMGMIDMSEHLYVGNSYHITFNGVAYNCLGVGEEGNVFAGNMGIAGGADTGEPFLIVFDQYDGSAVATYDAGTFDVTISEVSETVHKIDEKYLPASGGAMVVEFVLNETMSGVESASKTVDEVTTAMLTGVVVGVIKVSMGGNEIIMPLGCATANGKGTPAFACFYDTGASSWVEQIGVIDGEWAFAVEK